MHTLTQAHGLTGQSFLSFLVRQCSGVAARQAQAAPRRIQLAGAVDGSNNRMDVEEVRRIYAGKIGTGQNVQISAEAAWDETVLGAV
jgi:hypothetical protein